MTETMQPRIRQWMREGRESGARWMLLVWDRFPWPSEPFPVFVGPGEHIARRFAEFDGHNMQRVTAVYRLNE